MKLLFGETPKGKDRARAAGWNARGVARAWLVTVGGGACVTVLVAWGLVWRAPVAQEGRVSCEDRWLMPAPRTWGSAFVRRQIGPGMEVASATGPYRRVDQRTQGMQFVIRAGWPWKALEAEQSIENDWCGPLNWIEESVRFEPRPSFGWMRGSGIARDELAWRAWLPVRPVWPGFVLDSLAMSVLIWVAGRVTPWALVALRLRSAQAYLVGWVGAPGRPVRIAEAMVVAQVLEPRARLRERVGRLALVGIAAAGVSYAVAVALCLRSNLVERTWAPVRSGPGVTVRVPECFSREGYEWRALYGADRTLSVVGVALEMFEPARITTVEAGWPWACARWSREDGAPERGGVSVGEGVLIRGGEPGKERDFERRIPLEPVWAGMGMDASVVGAGMLVGWRAWRLGRGTIRVVRNRCPACGQERGVAERCGECGLVLVPRGLTGFV